MNDDELMDELDHDEEYHGEQDIDQFVEMLREGWKTVPDLHFGDFISLAFNGYNLKELTPVDMEEMLNEFILQNK